MKKGILILVLLIAFSIPFVSADLNETAEKNTVQAANLWLINQVDGKWSTLSEDDLSLSLFALASDDRLAADGKTALLAKAKSDECWPSPSCKIKSTALSILALNKLGQNVDKAVAWIGARKSAYTATGVTWILQIDSDETTNCTINYDSKSYKITSNKDKTYSWASSAPSCFSITNEDFWLEISKNCLDKTFDVNCEKDAVVSLPYRSGNTLYVPSESFQTPTSISIKTVCLKEGLSCNYDATLWAAYALKSANRDYASLIPYLIDQKDANTKFMSDAILYDLTSRTEHAEQLLSDQSKEGYWADIGGFGKYYDTAIAYSAIKDYASGNATKAKEWLVAENKDGSWGTTSKIRDTAIVLSFVWPTAAIILPSNDCQNVYSYTCRTECLDDEEQVDYPCIAGTCCKPSGATIECKTVTDCKKRECKGEFVTDANGKFGKCEYLEELTCDDSFDNDADSLIDFSDNDCTTTCSQKGGKICEDNEACSDSVVRAYDTDSCCLGECSIAQTCAEQQGFECKSDQTCKDNAWLISSDSSYCCTAKCGSKLSIIPFIIIALILALGAGAYFLYKKGFFRKKTSLKKSIFSSPQMSQPVQAQTVQAQYRPPVRPLQAQPQSFQPQQPSLERRAGIRREVKSELDETMKKLKKLAEK